MSSQQLKPNNLMPSKVVRVSMEVYGHLKLQARKGETPDDTLRRLLGLPDSDKRRNWRE